MYRFSNVNIIFRITAYYVNRFLNNIGKGREKITGQLTVSEINEAEIYWLRVVQQEAFGSEVTDLLNKKPLSTKSSLLTLRSFIDENKVLRLGGR